MIHTNRIVTVGEQECIIDRPIVLYRGDREVEIEFTLVGNEFTFSEEGNVIKSVNASHGQLVLNTPSGEHMFSELAECHEGKVVFVVTKEMIDEFIEMGFYSFQIRLYDSAEMKSRVTIPPVMNGFDIRNPIAAEDETNLSDLGVVDYSRVGKDEWEDDLPTFDNQGNYNKTDWQHHDVIYTNKLNKIEDALYSINDHVGKSDVVMLDTLDQVKKDADTYVKEHIAEVEADAAEFERNLNTDVQQFKIDTNAAMTAHKNEVSEVVDGFSGEIESINSQLDTIENKFYYVTPEMFGAKGDGVNDDTLAIQQAIDFAHKNNIRYIKLLSKVYNISPIQDTHYDRKVCLLIRSNVEIRGSGTKRTLLKVVTKEPRYFSVFYQDDMVNPYSNITLKDFTIDQNPDDGDDIKLALNNNRFILGFFGINEKLTINNVEFLNASGTNGVTINNKHSKDIRMENCYLSFKVNPGVTDTNYDRSLVYLNCTDYIFSNNIIDGNNYECFGGLEPHGYNGIVSNNNIRYCRSAINVAPTFANSGHLKVENNILENSFCGITLWDNTDDDSEYGLNDIIIKGNTIKVDVENAKLMDDKIQIAGIITASNTFRHPVENIIVENNYILFDKIENDLNINTSINGGILFNRSIDFKNIFIKNNFIFNSPTSGIFLGTTDSVVSITLNNIIISENVIKNNGYCTSGISDYYLGSITIGYKNFNNILIKNNMLINDASDINTKHAFCVLASSTTESNNCYFKENFIDTIHQDTMKIFDYRKNFIQEAFDYKTIISPNGTVFKITVTDEGELDIKQ